MSIHGDDDANDDGIISLSSAWEVTTVRMKKRSFEAQRFCLCLAQKETQFAPFFL